MLTNLWAKASNLSFKTKAISIAVLLAVVPVIGTGAFAGLLSAQNNRTQEREQQKLSASALSQSLTRFIDLRSTDIQNVAIVANATDATALAKTPIAEHERVLKALTDRFAMYDTLAIVALNGETIATSNSLNREANYRDRDFFQKTIESGKPQISTIENNPSSNRTAFYLSAPAFDRNGKMVSIIVARMPVTALLRVTKTFGDGNNSWSVIDRKSGKIILAADDLQSGRNVNESFPSFRQYKSTGSMTVEETDLFHKRQKLITYRALIPSPGSSFDLVATAEIGMESLVASERQIWLAIGLGTLFAGGLTAGVAFLLSDRITRYVQRAISTITTSANEIVGTVQLQEVTVNNQAVSAISTAETMNELESISTETAEQATASANGAQQALSLAEEGTQAVRETINEMGELRARVNDIAQQIVNLGEQTGQITTISDLVSDLAKQTNMLALKAAVEAARAGEQGKGFGVVAGEIRKLADESKKSAQKINNLANDIQTSINRTVMVTDLGTKSVSQGIQLAQNTATTFIGVTDAVNNVFLNSQQISSRTQRQATAIQQVLSTMTKISQESQESAVGMHRVKTSTQELNMIADELQTVVN